MSIQRIYSIIGYVSVLCGIASVMGMMRIKWLYMACGIGVLGMVLGIINIFLNTRYFSDSEKMPKGYFGLFLSALPIVFWYLVFQMK